MNQKKQNNALTLTVSTVMQLLGLVNLFIMFFYSQKLKNTSCECSADWRRTFMNVYSLVMLAFFPLVTIVLLAVALLSGKTKKLIGKLKYHCNQDYGNLSS